MKELTSIYREVGQQFIDDLFKNYLVVTEKLTGSHFSFERNDDSICFYKSNDKPINIIDRTLMIYYENPITYIKNTVSPILSKIPNNWKFCFQYFVHNEPGAIKYDIIPKNNLVLTHIQIKSHNGKMSKIIEDPRVLADWANTLKVTPLVPIFKGYLTDTQKQKISEFITTPIEDQHELFNTSSFASHIINVLNPNVNSTMLQSDLLKPIESIIFKFYKPGTTETFSAKLIDPYAITLMKNRPLIDVRRLPADMNEILLLDILAFIEERGLRRGEILSSGVNERYLELICNIFNDYVIRRGHSIQNIELEKAEFAKGDEFNLNTNFISSETTRNFLKNNQKLQDLFKIMLGSLRKKRNPDKTGNVMTNSVIADFNSMVSRIEELILSDNNDEFKTFSDYLQHLNIDNNKVLEKLSIGEKILDYNNFINIGKITI